MQGLRKYGEAGKNIHPVYTMVSRFNRFDDLALIKRCVINWQDVPLFYLGAIKKLRLRLRDGTVANINNFDEYFDFFRSYEWAVGMLKSEPRLKESVRIDKNQVSIEFNGHKIKFLYSEKEQIVDIVYAIMDQFFRNQYAWLDVKGRTVVDIGANMGDTAIYFALGGAKKVYAFEPYPYSYMIGLKNLEANRLGPTVRLFNKGCGGASHFIHINGGTRNSGGTVLKASKVGKKIEIVTLDDIVRRFEVGPGAMLKIDCEGCEYGIILNANEDSLTRFDKMMIEYHYGYRNLVKKLRACGFRCRTTIPMFIRVSGETRYVGIIYAERARA